VAKVTQIKERIEGHYEVEEVPYGRVYKWTPGYALVECEECGQLTIVDAVATACPKCGADYTTVARGLGGKPLEEDEAYYLERRGYEEWQRKEETHPHLKHYEWLEIEAL